MEGQIAKSVTLGTLEMFSVKKMQQACTMLKTGWCNFSVHTLSLGDLAFSTQMKTILAKEVTKSHLRLATLVQGLHVV